MNWYSDDIPCRDIALTFYLQAKLTTLIPQHLSWDYTDSSTTFSLAQILGDIPHATMNALRVGVKLSANPAISKLRQERFLQLAHADIKIRAQDPDFGPPEIECVLEKSFGSAEIRNVHLDAHKWDRYFNELRVALLQGMPLPVVR
jgi:hypothetical protein